ncbi:pimeloyl-ACP methyl ester carboxylesterase [Rhizobium sp. ERR 922]|uniref:alpha/beta fold hydrolase n=1 Tax=unclassified Rhizobium TaxID=2613769 RepID=UPI0011A8BB56|nr:MULTISPECIES: alpha/beta hydrolase [unclassified Rhizobium]TWB45010.1 pimeloyl-ACP methyl ester carboxylesterase [Rhizobium sp. ERR 922]TWB87955.1 pimeloyl-ACP methyl ester carboxylesterase [Rhizobium sp. ERR 942]
MTASPSKKPTVVLVHGAWADASSLRSVIPLLQKRGVPVVAVQNPTSSLLDDVEATRHVLNEIDGPVVLAGHSWGGTVITEAGDDPKVKALVFVAAFAPDVGQSTGDQVAAYPAPPALADVSSDRSGRYRMSVNGWVNAVAQDLPEQDARLLAATQPPLGADTFSDKVSRAAWMDRKNWYVISTEDQAVSVELQRELAKKLNARTIELKAGHMSLLSQPEAIASAILEAVAEASAA